LDVPLQRPYIVQESLISVENKQLLKRSLDGESSVHQNPSSIKYATPDLQGEVVFLTEVPRQLDDDLHPLYLAFNFRIEIFFLHGGETKKMDRPRVL